MVLVSVYSVILDDAEMLDEPSDIEPAYLLDYVVEIDGGQERSDCFDVTNVGSYVIARRPWANSSLIIRVSIAGGLNEPPEAVVRIAPAATFADLLAVTLQAFGFEDDSHLGMFWIAPDRKTNPRGHHVWPKLPDDTTKIEVLLPGCEPLGNPDGHRLRVADMVTLGNSWWCQFDFGDEWWFRMKAISARTAGFSLDPIAARTEIIKPCRDYQQYPYEGE